MRSNGPPAIGKPSVKLKVWRTSCCPPKNDRYVVIAAMALTAVAGGLLAFRIAPLQREALTSPDTGARLRRIGMSTGAFDLVWVVVVVLMVVRPGETA